MAQKVLIIIPIAVILIYNYICISHIFNTPRQQSDCIPKSHYRHSSVRYIFTGVDEQRKSSNIISKVHFAQRRNVMCIMFIYRNPEAGLNEYRIVLAFNRDESLTRPTASAHWWKNDSRCLGGLDMEPGKEGGSWLAVSTEGRLGALLNLTGEKRPSTAPGKGRGYLVTDYVTSDVFANEYLTKLHEKNHIEQTYNPYNLVLLNLWTADVDLLCSAGNSTGPQRCFDKILGFGNSEMSRPFKKVTVGKGKFKSIVEDATVSDQDTVIERLLEFLKWNERHLPDPELERRAPNWYKDLSSIFVNVQGVAYGTRTHSILLLDGSNHLTFVEETLMPDASWKCQIFNKQLQALA